MPQGKRRQYEPHIFLLVSPDTHTFFLPDIRKFHTLLQYTVSKLKAKKCNKMTDVMGLEP